MDASSDRAAAALEALIARLHGRGRLRVWSLVITLFGDAILPRGGEAPLALIQDVMARLGIEAGAVRTAMSRLAADHWVERERRGRNSFFRLDARGRHAFDLATRRIYAAGPPAWDGSWTVAIATASAATDTAAELTENGFLKLADNIFLCPRALPEQNGLREVLSDMLVIRGSSAEHPEQLRNLWPSQDIANAYRDLLKSWMPYAFELEQSSPPPALDAMAARTLLIHDWRRIVLRDPGLPAALLPRDWPGEEARAMVAGIYGKLVANSERWLDEAGLPAQTKRAAFAARFCDIKP